MLNERERKEVDDLLKQGVRLSVIRHALIHSRLHGINVVQAYDIMHTVHEDMDSLLLPMATNFEGDPF
jgi:hypothetical protein